MRGSRFSTILFSISLLAGMTVGCSSAHAAYPWECGDGTGIYNNGSDCDPGHGGTCALGLYGGAAPHGCKNIGYACKSTTASPCTFTCVADAAYCTPVAGCGTQDVCDPNGTGPPPLYNGGNNGSFLGGVCAIYLASGNPCTRLGFQWTDGVGNLCHDAYGAYLFNSADCSCPGSDLAHPWRGASDSNCDSQTNPTNAIPIPNVAMCCSDPAASNYGGGCGGKDKDTAATSPHFYCTYGPTLGFSPTSYPFGNVVQYTKSLPQTITITNSGGGAASNCSFSVDNANFILTPGSCALSGAGIAASGGSCTVYIKANPQSVGGLSTKFNVSCTGYSNSTAAGSFTVTGTAAPACSSGASSAAAPFGCTADCFGQTPRSKHTVISNGTSCDDYITSLGNGCIPPPDPAQSYDLYSCITCTSPATPVWNIGSQTWACSKSFAASPTSLDWGTTVYSGGNSNLTVRVTNNGGLDGSTCSVPPVPTGSGMFSFVSVACNPNTGGDPITAGGGYCDYIVKFSPTNTTAQVGNLPVTCTGGGGTNTINIPLTGTGAVPPVPILKFVQGSPQSVGSFPAGSTQNGIFSFNVNNLTGNGSTADATGCTMKSASTGGANQFQSITFSGGCSGTMTKDAAACAGQINVVYNATAGSNTSFFYMECTGGVPANPINPAPPAVYDSPLFQITGTSTETPVITSAPFADTISTNANPVMSDMTPNQDTRPQSPPDALHQVAVTFGGGVGQGPCYGMTATPSSADYTFTKVDCFANPVPKGSTCHFNIFGHPAPPAPMGPAATQTRNSNFTISCAAAGDGMHLAMGPYVAGNATLETQECPTGAVFVAGSAPAYRCNCSANTPPLTTFSSALWKCIACPYGAILDSAGYCDCPYSYTNISNYCKPVMPSGEFVRNNTGTTASSDYPVCTPPNHFDNAHYRIPTTYGLSAILQATTNLPSGTNDGSPTGMASPTPYPYATPVGFPTKVPKYFYANQPHCACTYHSAAPAPTPTPGDSSLLSPTVAGGNARFAGDTYDFIATLTNKGIPAKRYGMIPIANDGASDGRLGAIMNATSGVMSQCSCPNVNEASSLIDASDPQSGVVCKPSPAALGTDPNIAFAPFNPAQDDQTIYGTAQVTTSALELRNAGVIVSTVNVPASQAAPNSLKLYQRHIWKCQLGYYWNGTACTIDPTKHKCDSTSPIAAGSAWATTINKKLACCLNQFDNTPATYATTNSSTLKFDCVDNAAVAPGSFDALWASTDQIAPTDTGGQLNAILLTDGHGKPLTGFYTKDGQRCDEYTEFSSNTITRGTLNASIVSGQQAVVGTGAATDWVAGAAIPKPAVASQGWVDITGGLTAAGKATVAPDPNSGTAAEFNKARRCPILVRAAMVAKCPANQGGANAPHFTITASGITRCLSAQSIQVHMRIEQVFNIAGESPLQTIDTISESKTAGTINVEQLIRQKNGANCAPGTVQGSSGCRY